MKITNDVVSFESKDLVAFSEPVLAALALTAGESRTVEQVLSEAVNAAIAASGRSRVNGLLEAMRPVAEKLAGLSKADADAAMVDIDTVAGL